MSTVRTTCDVCGEMTHEYTASLTPGIAGYGTTSICKCVRDKIGQQTILTSTHCEKCDLTFESPEALHTHLTLGSIHNPPKVAATGIKNDKDKPDMSLLSNIALIKVAQVMTFGKNKYAANNWRGGFAWTRPLAAAARHLYAYIGGEDKDPESGYSHLAHACCCLFFVLEFEDTKPELDDRYKGDK